MRVLLTNNTLNARAGSELYVYDVAMELLRRGHTPIAFSTDLGRVAGELRDATVPVVDDLARIGAPPDVIHGHHHFETLLAVLAFPDVPAVNFCHGWGPWEEEPLIHPRVLRYVAVDHVCRDRLELEHGISPDRIRVILNFVDVARFRPRTALPPMPRRALAFGNTFGEADAGILGVACDRAGIQLDVVGLVSGRPVQAPETLLTDYDIVFAKGRAALEAMAAGAGVVLCGPRGLGPLVTPEEWDSLRPLNFGVRTLTLPLTPDNVLSQMQRYDAQAAAVVSARVRREATLDSSVDALLELYQAVINEHSHLSCNPCGSQQAAARHLHQHADRFKGRASAIAWTELRQAREELERLRRQSDEPGQKGTTQCQFEEQLQLETGQLRQELLESEARCTRIHAELEGARHHGSEEAARRRALEAELASAVAGTAEYQGELAQCRNELRAIRESATWQLGRSILESAPAGLFAPLIHRIGQFVRRQNVR